MKNDEKPPSIKELLFKKGNLILIFGLILILFATTWIFTRPAIFESYNFKETGNIGDTIGGITAPILNLFGAILIYLSFQTQVKANQIQFNALKKQLEDHEKLENYKKIIELIQIIKSEASKISYKNKVGTEAIKLFEQELQNSTKIQKQKLFNSHFIRDWGFILLITKNVDNLLIRLKLNNTDKLVAKHIIRSFWIVQFNSLSEKLEETEKELYPDTEAKTMINFKFLQKTKNNDKKGT